MSSGRNSGINNYSEIEERFANITGLDEKGKSILENLRYRDGDQSVKAGAVLAFSGLMIASAVVQLTVSKESPLFISDNSVLMFINIVGIYCLFISCFMALYGLIISFKRYAEESMTALLQFDDLINERSEWIRYSIFISIFGAFCVQISFFKSILPYIQ